jgi:polyhydroxyalkanoate synthesis regulator phasin
MKSVSRRVVRYRNRKLYEATERRFVTIHDLARTVAQGGRVEVISADSGEDITAKILSRALASGKAPVAASTDTLTRILQAGSEAAGTVAAVVEKVGGAGVAERMRRAARPERLAEAFGPLTRRFEDARQDVEQIVGGLVEKGRLTWEEGTRLRDDVGSVFHDSLADVIGRVRDLAARLNVSASPEMAAEIADLRVRLEQLESLASRSFPGQSGKSTNISAARAARQNRRARPASPATKRRSSS